MKLDIAARETELAPTEHITVSETLLFAGLPRRTIEVIDVHRHAAEKFHALTSTYHDRPNTRVRDLIDLTIMIDQNQLDPVVCAQRVEETFNLRGTHQIVETLPKLPASWPTRYENLTDELETNRTFDEALKLVEDLWHKINS
jgi:hypothetical protein